MVHITVDSSWTRPYEILCCIFTSYADLWSICQTGMFEGIILYVNIGISRVLVVSSMSRTARGVAAPESCATEFNAPRPNSGDAASYAVAMERLDSRFHSNSTDLHPVSLRARGLALPKFRVSPERLVLSHRTCDRIASNLHDVARSYLDEDGRSV